VEGSDSSSSTPNDREGDDNNDSGHITSVPDAILPPRALDRRLQEDCARDAREGPRVLMSLRIDFWPMG